MVFKMYFFSTLRFVYARRTQAHVALTETIAFSRAVDAADAATSQENTLIVVTSDHSHTMTINGYPSREDWIVGHAERDDGGPYSILSYANGPSAEAQGYMKQPSEYGEPKTGHPGPRCSPITIKLLRHQ